MSTNSRRGVSLKLIFLTVSWEKSFKRYTALPKKLMTFLEIYRADGQAHEYNFAGAKYFLFADSRLC